ncbi:hypothetical protein [Variovorax soli]|uniref:Type IV secretory pathway VirB10-like protein n=1 Tax=Variovorax soli TaxID=376815 RepID=A0ABU1N9V0_9BURK|nr:hypothetical protein [Variovorax soli]MDR6535189.1 type IV secretory pathway VirB10-like protein [Variovorax soli]
MKKLLLSLLIGLGAAPLWAQSTATTGAMDFEAERARLAQERKEVEERFATEQAACYQKFAVEGCLQDSRRRRRTATENIQHQEAAMNDIERKRRGAAALDRLEEKKSSPRPQDTAAEQEKSLKSQQEREQRAADHAGDRARLASEAAEKQRQFEQKQQAHAEEQAKAASRRAEGPTNREAYERKLEQAEKHRLDRERRNAQNTKPRSAPLPTPP